MSPSNSQFNSEILSYEMDTSPIIGSKSFETNDDSLDQLSRDSDLTIISVKGTNSNRPETGYDSHLEKDAPPGKDSQQLESEKVNDENDTDPKELNEENGINPIELNKEDELNRLRSNKSNDLECINSGKNRTDLMEVNSDEPPNLVRTIDSPIPDDPDVTIVHEKQFPPRPPVTASSLRNDLDQHWQHLLRPLSVNDHHQQTKLLDELLRVIQKETHKNPKAVHKILSDHQLPLPSSIAFPPSQVVEFLVEYPGETAVDTIWNKLMAFDDPFDNKANRKVSEIPQMNRLLLDIGLDLVQETTYSDIVHSRNLPEKPRNSHAYQQVADQLRPVWENLRKKNISFHGDQLKCHQCSFRSESILVLAAHRRTIHFDGRTFRCTFCRETDTNIARMKQHYRTEHGLTPTEEPASGSVSCSMCNADFDRKIRLDIHLRRCKLNFQETKRLLEPLIPDHLNTINRWLWPKPPSVQRLSTVGKLVLQSRPFRMLAPRIATNVNRVLASTPLMPTTRIGSTTPSMIYSSYRNPNPMVTSRQTLSSFLDHQQPSLSKSQLMCEICDKQLSDREHYLTHLQLFHKQLQNRSMVEMNQSPPLACSRCHQRFWTYEGLEQHLVMAHGLVTSDLLLKARKREDGGRCRICGKQYAFNLLQHLVAEHQMKLCSAEVMYSCDVCVFKCSSYSILETHLTRMHSKSLRTRKESKSTVAELLNRQRTEITGKLNSDKQTEIAGKLHSDKQMEIADKLHSDKQTEIADKLHSDKQTEIADKLHSDKQTEIADKLHSDERTASKMRIKYTCTPCALKFDLYRDVIAHWQRVHLNEVEIAVCRIDCCPLHREQLQRQYRFEFFFPTPNDVDDDDDDEGQGVITLD